MSILTNRVTNGSHGCDDCRPNVEYPRYCDLCTPDVKELYNRFEFAQHLRAMHCTKEGGSFICRWVCCVYISINHVCRRKQSKVI